MGFNQNYLVSEEKSASTDIKSIRKSTIDITTITRRIGRGVNTKKKIVFQTAPPREKGVGDEENVVFRKTLIRLPE